jgi:CubicO group peptidase (beta-lactamase class C family)
VIDLFDQVKSFAPLFAPNQVSTYSNLNFEILGLVLERITNQTYKDYIQEAIFSPLNMSHSTLSKPADDLGVIPVEPHWWDVEEGVLSPTGGIYSSSNDMSKYLRYVLTHFNALTPALNWFNPGSTSRGLHSFYGMPWEIFQTTRILKDTKRVTRFVTKSGGLPGYTSIIMLLPEYDLGVTLLLAGPPTFFDQLREIVSVALVRAAEDVAIRQLHESYAGTYTSPDPHLNSTVTLKADQRGLVITKWVSNSTDIYSSSFFEAQTPPHIYVQLGPTLLYYNEKKQLGERWRIMVVEERNQAEGGVWDDFCIEDYDRATYAGKPFNEVAFWDERKDGRFGVLELVGFRANLTRVDEDDDEEWENMEL